MQHTGVASPTKKLISPTEMGDVVGAIVIAARKQQFSPIFIRYYSLLFIMTNELLLFRKCMEIVTLVRKICIQVSRASAVSRFRYL